MSMDASISQLGSAGAAVVVVLAFLKYLKDERMARDKSYSKLVGAINKNTKIVTSADKYLKERNGRDIEIHKQLIDSVSAEIPKAVQKIADASTAKVISSMANIPKQNIEHQHVEQSVIKKESKS